MKVEGTVTLKVRVTADCTPGDTMNSVKTSLVKKADEYVKDNGIRPVVTDILIRSLEDAESLPPVDGTDKTPVHDMASQYGDPTKK